MPVASSRRLEKCLDDAPAAWIYACLVSLALGVGCVVVSEWWAGMQAGARTGSLRGSRVAERVGGRSVDCVADPRYTSMHPMKIRLIDGEYG